MSDQRRNIRMPAPNDRYYITEEGLLGVVDEIMRNGDNVTYQTVGEADDFGDRPDAMMVWKHEQSAYVGDEKISMYLKADVAVSAKHYFESTRFPNADLHGLGGYTITIEYDKQVIFRLMGDWLNPRIIEELGLDERLDGFYHGLLEVNYPLDAQNEPIALKYDGDVSLPLMGWTVPILNPSFSADDQEMIKPEEPMEVDNYFIGRSRDQDEVTRLHAQLVPILVEAVVNYAKREWEAVDGGH